MIEATSYEKVFMVMQIKLLVVVVVVVVSLSIAQLTIHAVFHYFHGLMYSINWPAPSVWVFIGQLVEHQLRHVL